MRLTATSSFQQTGSQGARRAARQGYRSVVVRAEEEGEKKAAPFSFGTLRLKGTRKEEAEAAKPAAAKAPSKGTDLVSRLQSSESPRGTIFFGFGGTKSTNQPKGAAGKTPDAKTVFVAGATGRTGLRTVRELLAAGFRVRAGVRKADKIREYVETSLKLELLSADEAKRLEVVEIDVTKPETLRPAIGNALKVVSVIGAPESDALNAAAPFKIDGQGTINLINAAADAGVEQFVLVTSLGTGKFGWPAGALNLFWGVLIWKGQAEAALKKSGLAYTIIRPGGMEKPTDSYKKSHNLVLKKADTTFGGQVSRLQVAELISDILLRPDLSQNKVLEVIAETTAPARLTGDLLASIDADPISREDQIEYLERRKELGARLAEADGAVQAVQAELESLAARRQDLADKAADLAKEEREFRNANAEVLEAAEAGEKRLAALRKEAEEAKQREAVYKAVLEAAKRAQRENRLLGEDEKKAIIESVTNPPKPKAPEPVRQAAKAPSAAVTGRGRIIRAEEEEEAKPAPAKAGGLFGFLSAPKPAEKEVVEEEEEEEEEPEPVQPAKKSGGLFGFLSAPKPAEKVVEEEEEEEEAPAPVPAARGPITRGRKPVADVAQQQRQFMEDTWVDDGKKEEEKKEDKPKPSGGLFSWLSAPSSPAAEAAPEEAAPEPAKPAAAVAVLERPAPTPKPEAPKPAPAAPKPEPTPAPAPVAAAPKPAPAPAASDLPENVAEARAWVAAWRAKQGKK